MKKVIIQYFVNQNLKSTFIFFVFNFIFQFFHYKGINSETILLDTKYSVVSALVYFITYGILLYKFIKRREILMNDPINILIPSVTFTADKTIDKTVEIIDNIIPYKIKANKFKYDIKQGIYWTKTRDTFRSWGNLVVIKLTQLDNDKTQLLVYDISSIMSPFKNNSICSMNIQQIKLAF